MKSATHFGRQYFVLHLLRFRWRDQANQAQMQLLFLIPCAVGMIEDQSQF